MIVGTPANLGDLPLTVGPGYLKSAGVAWVTKQVVTTPAAMAVAEEKEEG